MDQQHKKLFGLINNFYDALFADKDMEIIEEILEDLMDYTESHFTKEEAIMKQYNFPGYSLQKQLHDKLIKKVLDMEKRYLAGDKEISVRIAILLRDWWEDHIILEDKKYGIFLKSKGLA